MAQDTNMNALWQQVEYALKDFFPDSTRIVTPFSDPLFTTDEYQTFLRSLGFEPVAKVAFGKML